MIDLGFKDKAQGFLKFDEDNKGLDTGELVQIITKSSTSSKVIKCILVNKKNMKDAVISASIDSKNDRLVTIHTIKPGYYVNAKVTKVLENGLEVKFLSGMLGTVFEDHTGTGDSFKVGQKVQARVISVDPALKRICLSMCQHIVDLKPFENVPHVGQMFSDVKVEAIVFGSSFIVRLGPKLTGFLHKSHIADPADTAEDTEMLEEPKKGKKRVTVKTFEKQKAEADFDVGHVLK